MLETIREYAAERLAASDEADDLRRRHAEYLIALAESANLNPGKLARGGQRFGIAYTEQDNVRTALTWALASGSITLGLRLAVAMDQFWTNHDPREGIRWFAALLELPEVESVALDLRAHALRGYGASLDISGGAEAAEPLYEQSLALFEELGDESGRAVLLHRLGICAMRRGALEHARDLVEASDEIHVRKATVGAARRRSGHSVRSPVTPAMSSARST